MPKITLVQSEKSYLLQKNNRFMLTVEGAAKDFNKIEFKKILQKNSFNAIDIKVVNLPSKKKRRTTAKGLILKKRKKKYLVKLKEGETFPEDKTVEFTQ
jgi:ribosomal protein L23